MNPAPSSTPADPTTPTPFDDGALYDLIFENLDVGIDYYLGLARSAGGPILDVGCGTGRILLPCLKAGLDADGLDLFPGMLRRLREKATALGFHPTLHESDMASFRLPRRYALIMIPFNAIVHNLTVADQLSTLAACRDHLLPGGQLVFDTAFPGPAWINAPDGRRELELEISHPETGCPVRLWDTRTFDRVAQRQDTFNEIEMLNAEGEVIACHPSRTSLRWIYPTEMELLLRLTAFARWRIHGGFDGRPLRQETDAMIVHAWAN
jgi:SAM-dependent methyltransferase